MKRVQRLLSLILAVGAIITMASSASGAETPSPFPDPATSNAWVLLAKDNRLQGRVTDFQPGILLDLRMDDGTTPIFELDSTPPVTDAIQAGDRVQVQWLDLWMISRASPEEPALLVATLTAVDSAAGTATLQASTGESIAITGEVTAGNADLSFLKPGDRVHAEHTIVVREITKVSD